MSYTPGAPGWPGFDDDEIKAEIAEAREELKTDRGNRVLETLISTAVAELAERGALA